jgi:hypothetical protein
MFCFSSLKAGEIYGNEIPPFFLEHPVDVILKTFLGNQNSGPGDYPYCPMTPTAPSLRPLVLSGFLTMCQSG